MRGIDDGFKNNIKIIIIIIIQKKGRKRERKARENT